jgi:hypothetical protein
LLRCYIVQMLCGIAKDLTKLGGKTVTKLVVPLNKMTQPLLSFSVATEFYVVSLQLLLRFQHTTLGTGNSGREARLPL